MDDEFDDICEIKKEINSKSETDQDLLEAYSFQQQISQPRIRLGRALICIVIACIMSFILGYFYFKWFVYGGV